MADPTPAAWKKTATAVAPTLPGSWTTGGRGLKLVLAQTPIEWTLVWVCISRVRKDDDPHLMGGVTSLVSPVSTLGIVYGRRSDSVPGFPARVDLTAPDAADLVRRFVADALLPIAERWSVDRRAAEAELQVKQSEAERVAPVVWADAAGWRVVLDTGSPVDVAEELVERAEAAGVPETAAWYRGLIEAWTSGGRDAALAYLAERRDEAIGRLGLA